MTVLLWRQHRHQFAIALAALAAFAVLLLGSGPSLNDTYRSALQACRAAGDCGGLSDNLFKTDWDRFLLVAVLLTVAVPVVLGVFWGAPLVAREAEAGTLKLAWTQAITRRRWFAGKTALFVAAAVVWGAAVGGLVTWWSQPFNSLHQNRFDFGQFDTQGIVPIGYAVFAVALGILCGARLRRSLPALAVTLGAFTAVHLAITYGLRPHYLPAVTATVPFGTMVHTGPGSVWYLSNTLLNPAGQNTHGVVNLKAANCAGSLADSRSAAARCLAAHGWRYLASYQPANRFWTFQGIETGIYLALAALMIAIAYRLVTRRDA